MIAMFIIMCMAVDVAHTQGTHGKEYWRRIAANHYAVPEGQKAFALAKELSGYLKVSDPELRDDLAYSVLATWILEQDDFSREELLALEEWRRNLKGGDWRRRDGFDLWAVVFGTMSFGASGTGIANAILG